VTPFLDTEQTDWSVFTAPDPDSKGDTPMFHTITSHAGARLRRLIPGRRADERAPASARPRRNLTLWTMIVTSVAAFIVTLDNLVVTTALPSIHRDLHASIQGLEWTVNAYTLTFAVLLLTGAALGDRFGRRRTFVLGLVTFVLGSAGAALAPSIGWLIAARAFQGVGGAIVAPLTLTILSAAVPAERRGAALGIWGAVSGLAIGLGPVVGGAVVQSISWQWIFWLNVPITLALIPFAMRRLEESHGPNGALDLPGLGLASTGLFGLVLGVIRGNQIGWGSAQVLALATVGAALLAAFVAWELRTPNPMLPMRFFRNRTFTAANVTSLLMSFGMFGAIFLLTQFLQTAQGYSPLQAGLRVLPWTAMPLLVAPIAGALSDRIGGRPLMATGVALQAGALAWLASVASATVPYAALIGPFVMAGIGLGLFFAPVANVVLGSVAPDEEGQASGANNAIRELGGVFGVAVLASIFTHYGSYHTPHTFVNGLTPALYIGALIVALGAIAALFIERKRRTATAPQTQRTAAQQAPELALQTA
jgi:EmrB/QacA subfamily drug resistance transporter